MSRDYSYCAGVLPYTDFNNSIYFLMGKSRRNGRLITFSGKNDLIDEGIEETAAREFFEESLGCVMDKASALAAIKKCRIVLKSRTPRNMPCYTYMIEVPFRKIYTVAFHKTKDFLNEIKFRSFEFNEMCDIKWICARSMLDKVRKQWERTGCLTDPLEWKKIETLCARPDIDTISWRRPPPSETESDDDVISELSTSPSLSASPPADDEPTLSDPGALTMIPIRISTGRAFCSQ